MKNLFFLLLASAIICCQKDDDESYYTNKVTFIDTRDGHVYKSVQIGAQVWMAENLDYRTSDSSWYYNNDSATYHIYGRLYTWNSALTAAPPGWHLPTDAEWTTLTTYLGGDSVAGGKLKETGLAHWQGPNTGASNESGFTALSGGKRNGDGPYNYTFDYISNYAYWWSATEFNSTDAWYRCVYHKYTSVGRANYGKTYGLNIRCVKD